MTNINTCFLPKNRETMHGSKSYKHPSHVSPVLAVPLCPVQWLVGSQCSPCLAQLVRIPRIAMAVAVDAGSWIFSMFSNVLSKFWSRFKTKSQKKASNKTFTKDVLCSIVSSAIINLTFPQKRVLFSSTFYSTLFLGLKIVPSSLRSLNLSCLYCSCYLLSTALLPQSPWW